jgi:hypothetical protein
MMLITSFRLDQQLLNLENCMKLQKGLKQKMKSYISDKRKAIAARERSRALHHNVRVLSPLSICL